MLRDGSSGPVALVSCHSLLGPALAAGLEAVGWRTVRAAGWSALEERPPAERLAGIVLVADEGGALPPRPPVLAPGLVGVVVVAIGSRQDLGALVTAVEQGAVAAIDCEQPFCDLVAVVSTFLHDPGTGHDKAELLRRLRARELETRQFAAMTRRELDVLTALLRGSAAADIAHVEHVSMPTVRTHIRGVLTKAGVQSQVAAVALAYRSAVEPTVVQQIREVHQF